MSESYLILSKKWSRSAPREHAVWYRPEAHGYTTNIEEAGRFTKEEARAHTRSSEGVTAMVKESQAYAMAERLTIVAASEANIEKLSNPTAFGRLAPICF
jgi:hypothetical protein